MKPNVIFVFADQWRASALSYAGDPNVKTPNIDRIIEKSAYFSNAISCCPVCSPARATLMTGQFPHKHGVFLNNVMLHHHSKTLADCFNEGGYQTAYIGKWHLFEKYRSGFIPQEDRLGFNQYWKVLNCTHDYQNSYYYEGNESGKKCWDGYDAIAQTEDAITYVESCDLKNPFLLMLSWGPPHAPYDTAPKKYQEIYRNADIILPINVPKGQRKQAKEMLRGYYAHISVLDEMVGQLVCKLKELDLWDNTIFVLWSDHGDMLGSQGVWKKQYPYDESIKVPLIVHVPGFFEEKGEVIDLPINAADIMPTLLDLCGLDIPETVQGSSYANVIQNLENNLEDGVLIACYHPFGQYSRHSFGGREYRGIRTRRYTYVEDLNGPWLLFDNQMDPFQLNNLIDLPLSATIICELQSKLYLLLNRYDDHFEPSSSYLARWNYEVNEEGVFPYIP